MSGTLIVTMAGMGSRFAAAGYSQPKYEIVAQGRPLFDWSMIGMAPFVSAGWKFHFVARAGLEAERFISARAGDLKLGKYSVSEIEALTDGQATSALSGARLAVPTEPMAVFNIDTYIKPAALKLPRGSDIAGWMPCFPAPGSGWSFARLGGDGYVVDVQEKKRISSHATVGLYWFDKAERYCTLYQQHFRDGEGEVCGERYIAPMFNTLIANGGRVAIQELQLSDVGMMGTPEQVASFKPEASG